MKKGLLLALVCCVLCAPLGAWAEEPMSMMGLDALTGRDWSQSHFFTRMAELTGVSFTFQQYQDAEGFPKIKADVLSSAVLPDVLFKAGLTSQEELRYAENGVLIDLAPLLQENAPNLWALLEAHPDWKKAITLPDGKIVALPALADPADQVCIWINRSWLDVLGLEIPATPEAYREALIAFRDRDPNGNGKRDEVPLYLVGPWEAKWLMSFFGLAANDYNVYLDEAGTVRFAPFEPQYAEFLAYLRELNQQELLGKDAFRTTHSMAEQLEKQAETVRVGGMISLAPYTLLDIKHAGQFAAMPPMAYQGRTVYRDLLGPVWRGTFAITNTCEYPVAALSWADALYTEEGAVLAMAGREGTDFQYDDKGKWNLLVDEMRTADSLRTESLMDSAGGQMPGVRPRNFLAKVAVETQLQMMEQMNVVGQAARLPMPLYYLTEAEQAEIDALQAELGALVDMGIARFATGETPLDEQHLQEFAQQLRDAGAEKLVAAWQRIADANK